MTINLKILAIITTFLLSMTFVHAGELSDEAKKIAREAIEFDRLLLDYKDLIDMNRVEQAKHLNYKLVRYTNILTRVKDLAKEIEELESSAQKHDSQFQKAQDELANYKKGLEKTEFDLNMAQNKFKNTKRALDSIRSNTNSGQIKLRNTQSKLYACQSRLKTLESSYNDCRSELEDCE